MADITISDLELAPALADDMVLAVENTTETYAATLAMLRRLLNKTFVEEEDADFNDLTDDGFYQCTGTPTNSPVAGTIDWTLQVSSQGGLTVQRAFSLDDDFANLYIRRWNGVSWTAWIEEGGGALTHKANVDADNFTADGKSNIVHLCVPVWGMGTDVSATAYASSGTGYRPTKDGVLQIMLRSLNGYTPYVYIYTAGGTLAATMRLSVNGAAGAAQGDLVILPASKDFSYRISGAYGNDGIYFTPYKGA